jgi:hypothetical protein
MNPSTPHALPNSKISRLQRATLGIDAGCHADQGPWPDEINRAYTALGTNRPEPSWSFLTARSIARQ